MPEEDQVRADWLAAVPGRVAGLARQWDLDVGEPFARGRHSAWIAPVVWRGQQAAVLKLGRRHFEAEHEAEALRLWDGDGAVRCLAAHTFEDTSALLLERCEPGVSLRTSASEEEQDVVVSRLLRRIWSHVPPDGAVFRSLGSMCAYWADVFERRLAALGTGTDLGLAREALDLLRDLPQSANQRVLLCTDLHAENVLSARREPWLIIDPKPFLGDPSFDPVQHMLNCERRLASDPGAMVDRLASLLDLDRQRTRLWLFARCAQEGIDDPAMRTAARRLAP